MQRAHDKGMKQINMIDMENIETRMRANKRDNKQTSKKANKQASKQKMVSARDKCRFGLGDHNFIVLKYG